jgi:hypothetical protein
VGPEESRGDASGSGRQTQATDVPARVRTDPDATERLLTELYELDGEADAGDDDTVRRIEPVVAWLKGWREDVALAEWLDLLSHVPRRFFLAVRVGSGDEVPTAPPATERVTTYVRYDTEYGWRRLDRTADGLAAPVSIDREDVASIVANRVVQPDVIDALDPQVRGRFVLPD